MKNKTNYILFVLLFHIFSTGTSKEISIKHTFSSVDLYNTLTDSDRVNRQILEFDITVKNEAETDRQLYLSFINPTIDRIVIFENEDSIILGDLIPFVKRTFKHTNHVHPVFLKTDSIRHFKIKIYNQNRHLLNVRVNLASENTFIKITNHDNFFNGIYYGILFIFLMLLFCFYYFSKSNFFSIYLMINIFMLLLMMLYNGTGYQFIWFYSSTIQKYISVVAAIGYLTSHILFVRSFFSVQFNNLSRYIPLVFLLIILFFGIILFSQYYNRVFNYSTTDINYLLVNGIFILYGIMIIALCIYTYLESGRREIVWVLIGIIFHIANWIIFINNEFASVSFLNYINNLKLYSGNIFVPQLNYFICMLEIFIVTIFIAINYHQLIRQNNISSQRLEFLQKRNINTFVLGQEEEREKISNQIEKDISKDIQKLKISLSNFHPKEDNKNTIPVVLNDLDKTLTDINNITGNYVAPDMQQMKLTELIITATDKLFQEVSTSYDFNAIPENLKLNEAANINLYRILQEISNNALKHAEADNITISTIMDDKSLQLKISDDGLGFTGNALKNKGIGLLNIESRMNSLNGNFYFLSNKTNGTTIHLIMPLKEII